MATSLGVTPFLADPSGSSRLVEAAHWAQGTLLGSAATIVAVLCVASVGFLMFSGRVDVRRGIAVVIGCFILFGAPVIVAGLAGIRSDAAEPEAVASISAPPPAPIPDVTPPPYDPYAGAAVSQ